MAPFVTRRRPSESGNKFKTTERKKQFLDAKIEMIYSNKNKSGKEKEYIQLSLVGYCRA